MAPEPGRHSLKCQYELSPAQIGFRGVVLEKAIEIDVRKPDGDDLSVFNALKDDVALISALHWPDHYPKADVIPKLEMLLKEFPTSTYADYLRFALAKAYWANRAGINSDRVRTAMAADVLQEIVFTRSDAIRREHRHVYFPYQPRALLMLAKADPEYKRKVIRYLCQYFPDSLEWLDHYKWMIVRSEDLELVDFGEFAGAGFASKKEAHIQHWQLSRKRQAGPEVERLRGN
jgi:hypothetical protein